MGEPQRGSTIFESVLKNYPKRTDVWSVYIDMSIKEGDLEQVRYISCVLNFWDTWLFIFKVLQIIFKSAFIWTLNIFSSFLRNIFERVTTFNMSLKKMKFLFKRYIEFEEQYGSKATVKEVQKKALEYVERTNVDED